MFYISWNENDIAGLLEDGISRLWTEIDDSGTVRREVGFNELGIVCHKFPGEGKFGSYGIFDLLPVELSNLKSSIDERDFERAFSF